jgi:glucose-6-phosphate dehydrogenase assembly protein OpcA
VSGDTRLTSFTKGEEIVVDVQAIERDLAALWRQASADQDAQRAVTRACLWNLVFHAEGEEIFWRIKKLIDAISPAVPARVLVLRPEPVGEGPELEAWISANCHIAPGGGKLLCSEEVTITGRGPGAEHFPGVVRALLVPDVPVAFYWAGPPPTDLRASRPLLAGIDRLLVDTGDLEQEDQLKGLAQFATAASGVDLADLGWLRLAPYRFLLASLFDRPVGADPVVTAKRVTLEVAPKRAATAVLLLGWMSSRLKWGRPRRTQSSGHRQWIVARMGGEVVLEVKESQQLAEETRHGIVSIEIESSVGSSFKIRRVSEEYAEISSPNMPTRTLSAPSHKDEELMVAALGVRGHDPLFAEALARAAEIERAAEAL